MNENRPILKKILEQNKWFIIPAILVLYVSTAILMLIGLSKLYFIIVDIIKIMYDISSLDSTLVSAHFIGIIEIYVLAIVFYIFALSIYKLFIGTSISIKWLKVENINDLKSNISKMSVLFLSTLTIQKIAEWKNSVDTLYFGIVIVMICAILIWYFKHMDKKEEE